MPLYNGVNLVLGGSTEDFGANNPLIGYDNVAGEGALSATSSEASYPVSNLLNPATHLQWRSALAGPQYVILEFADDFLGEVDYVGIAGHNFGVTNGAIEVSIEGITSLTNSPSDWFELTAGVLLPNDSPALFRFEKQSLAAIRVRMQASPTGIAPRMAVMYVGELLVLQRRIYVGHTPINYGRSARITNGRSESGHFLGRIVLSEKTTSGVQIRHITADWYRTYLDPFIEASKETPFFFAWRPEDYPLEVGYVWMTNEPQPQNQLSNGMMQIDLQFTGIVK
jgi:hypothetical protein